MNLAKSYDFFQPSQVIHPIHIIGCGSVGSTVAENLVRCGITKIELYDFDKVEAKNINNQTFFDNNIGEYKTDALKEILCNINPEAKRDIVTHNEGWNGETLDGYIIMAVDNIETRKEIVETHKRSPLVKAVFDFRTGLTDAEHYAAEWNNREHRKNLEASMNFTHDEVKENVSACGEILGVATTVKLISALGVNNFINYIKSGTLKTYINIDGFSFILDAFN